MKSVLSSVFALGCVAVVGCAGTTSDGASSSEADVTAPSSAYTTLEGCPVTESGEEGGYWSNQICPGMPGWSLFVQDGDGRSNVQVKFGEKAMDLGVWSRLPAFSHLGPKAEWRGPVKAAGVVDPYALIFRFYQSNGEGPETNFLVVSRITPTASCIVGLVNGGEADANQKARDMADGAKAYVCPGTDAAPANATSIFTSMENCTVTHSSDDEGGWSESACKGTAGYSIDIFDGDLRQNVKVKTATGETDLQLWSLGGGGSFSWVGPTADWRVHGPNKEAHALIFRRHEQIDEAGHESNWLVVVKLAGDLACVYDVIDAKKHTDANILAHVSADEAYSQSCPAQPPAAH